jgi:hypothetical protein
MCKTLDAAPTPSFLLLYTMETRISHEDPVFLDLATPLSLPLLANICEPLPISQREERLRESYPLLLSISSRRTGGGD